MSRKLRIGDVFEVGTPRGYIYAQYTHHHRDPPRYGPLVRVPRAIFDRPLPNPASALGAPDALAVFVPIDEDRYPEVRFSVVGNFAVPKRWREFPSFRSGAHGEWSVWRGGEDQPLGSLTREELLSLPKLEVWTPYVLVFEAFAAAGEPASTEELDRWFGIDRRERGEGLSHYLYFPSEEVAQIAAQRLRGRGIVEIRQSDDHWLVLLQTNDADEDEFDYLEALADELNGEYDGWEVRI